MTLIACNPSDANEGILAPKDDPVTEQGPVFEAYTTKISEFKYLIESSGKIIAAREERIFALNSGLIDYCNISNGMVMSKSSNLIRFDTRLLNSKINKAKKNIFNSRMKCQSDLLSWKRWLKTKKG